MMKMKMGKGDQEEFYNILKSAAQGDEFIRRLEEFIGKPKDKEKPKRQVITLKDRNSYIKIKTS